MDVYDRVELEGHGGATDENILRYSVLHRSIVTTQQVRPICLFSQPTRLVSLYEVPAPSPIMPEGMIPKGYMSPSTNVFKRVSGEMAFSATGGAHLSVQHRLIWRVGVGLGKGVKWEGHCCAFFAGLLLSGTIAVKKVPRSLRMTHGAREHIHRISARYVVGACHYQRFRFWKFRCLVAVLKCYTFLFT